MTHASWQQRAGAAWQQLASFTRGMLGANAYQNYLQHHRVTRCPHPPLSEREFWKHHYDEMERNPSGRCC